MTDTTQSLTLAVLSDLHTYDDSTNQPPSFLNAAGDETLLTQHPFASLLSLIKTQQLHADALICCGDLCDKAKPAAAKYAWTQLHHTKTALNAAALFATPGNHDVDSRHKYNDHDARGMLQGLVPPFPSSDNPTNDHFWSRNYYVASPKQGYRVVVLNSAAYHGAGESEFERGRVSNSTVEHLRQRLTADTPQEASANIFVCHHHLFKYSEIDGQDNSEMVGAENLLTLLRSGTYGPWLIIHGHKHQPHISYAPGGTTAPLVFSAGSFAAYPYPALQGRARNQFYILTLDPTAANTIGVGIAGRFQAWDWCVGRGWLPASPQSGIPARGGFGCKQDTGTLAKQVASTLTTLGASKYNWDSLTSTLPQLTHLLPEDSERLVTQLSKLGYNVLHNNEGTPIEIGTAP